MTNPSQPRAFRKLQPVFLAQLTNWLQLFKADVASIKYCMISKTVLLAARQIGRPRCLGLIPDVCNRHSAQGG